MAIRNPSASRYDNAYSRLVAWLKILLPLAALSILSTLFLVSRSVDPEAAIPYSDVEVAVILREQKIAAPEYSGMTRDGTAITLSSDSARPEGNNRVSAEALVARLDTSDGGRLDIDAGRGVIDTAERVARMEGGVRMQSSTGYVIETEEITASLDATFVESAEGIVATGPAGDIRAGRMELRRSDDGEGSPSYHLVFTDRVRLIYQPLPDQGGEK